jgi:glycine cleavage system T protein (aminomethyltransferase)
MLKTTPFHARTALLCESHAWRRWSGYVVASSYELSHEREYHAIRSSAALLDVSPLYKYAISGRDAARLLDRVATRDVARCSVGQVLYTCWCDGDGKVLDDGTIARLEETRFRMTSAEPNLRWLEDNAIGLEVEVADVSERIAALALQGPSARLILEHATAGDVAALKYFRIMPCVLRGVPVEISRTGYTGDLGYEIWIPARHAVAVWDALMERGQPFDIKPCGMLALDVARVEAGLLLIDVDFFSSKKAMIEAQRYTPYEMGLGRLVNLDKPRFIGQQALKEEHRRGHARQVVGLEVDWTEVEAIYERLGLAPSIGATASRIAVPVYSGGRQVGRATTTTWSPVLKRMIALATVDRTHFSVGTQLHLEVTVEAVRYRVAASVVKTPFFNPPRKVA